MPRAEVGTPKYVANQMKAKGLQRLRWYCQVCEKQCRDDNGFKCHLATEGHLRQMLVVGESAGKHISDFSQQFQSDFVTMLSRNFGTHRIKANNVYQEFIKDRHHLHMNATRWLSLTEFIKHLGRSGIVRVDETEKGLFIQWIDNSPQALAKAEANQKKERSSTSDEQRERILIAEQIARAQAEAAAAGEDSESPRDADAENAGLLKREEGAAPLKLAFGTPAKKSQSPPAHTTSESANEAASSAPSASTPSLATTSSKSSSAASSVKPQAALKFNAFKSGPLAKSSTPAATKPTPALKMNVFKAATPVKAASSPAPNLFGNSAEKRSRDELPVAERLMLEDQERKKRRIAA